MVCKLLVFFMSAFVISHPQTTLGPLEKEPGAVFLRIKQDLDRAIKAEDYLSAADAYQQIGDLFYYQTAYSQALDHFFKADKYYRKQNARFKLALNLNKIGFTYYRGRQYSAATAIFTQSLAIFKGLNNRRGLAQTYGLIGQTHEKTNGYKKALQYQQLAVTYYKMSDDKSGLAKIYENIGSLHEDKLQLDSALTYFNRSLALNQVDKNQLPQIEVYNNIGDVYRKSGSYRESLKYTRQAAVLAAELGDQYQLGSAYRDLSKAFNLLGRNDSAYHYSEAGRNIFLKIYTEDNEKQLALLQTLFEMEQKDNAISRFESEKSLNRMIAFAAALIAVLIALLGMSIISRQRLKIRNEHKLHEQNRSMLKGELELKSKELTTHTLHIIRKNELLDELKTKLSAIVKDDKRDQRKELKQLLSLISLNHNQDKSWEDFRAIFENVHEHFFESVKKHAAQVSAADLRLLALLKMNLGSADIATMLGISPDSLRISRYRLRKKLGLPEGESLTAFVQKL